MAPLKSTDGLSVGKLLGVFRDRDLTLNSSVKSDRYIPPPPLTVDYLVIAGGGGATGYNGSGAGGYRTSYGTSGGNTAAEPSLTLEASTNYTVTIGAGAATPPAGNGSDSVFHTITSLGGGGGYALPTPSYVGASGGSGAGSQFGPPQGGAAGAGTPGQGFPGGTGTDGVISYTVGGGGGGAGGAGTNAGTAPTPGGPGGVGLASTITGSSVTRGGGGGGVSNSPDSGSTGGVGGGGDGTASFEPTAPSFGQVNTGGGGGGHASGTGGSGGSGVVILRYPTYYSITNPGGGLVYSSSPVGVDEEVTTFTSGTGNISFTS